MISGKQASPSLAPLFVECHLYKSLGHDPCYGMHPLAPPVFRPYYSLILLEMTFVSLLLEYTECLANIY